MDALPRPDNLEVLPVLWGRIGQPPRPREGDTDGAAVCEMRRDEVVRDLDGENPWIITRHSGHAMSPRYAPNAPESGRESDSVRVAKSHDWHSRRPESAKIYTPSAHGAHGHAVVHGNQSCRRTSGRGLGYREPWACHPPSAIAR